MNCGFPYPNEPPAKGKASAPDEWLMSFVSTNTHGEIAFTKLEDAFRSTMAILSGKEEISLLRLEGPTGNFVLRGE